MANKIVGIKYTHDAGVAVIENDNLIIALEKEKHGHERHAAFNSLDEPFKLLESAGYSDIDGAAVVIDGWYQQKKLGYIDACAPYGTEDVEGALNKIFEKGENYYSTTHITNHILGAYCTSPFAKSADAAFVMIWDGGHAPMIYLVNPNDPYVKIRPYQKVLSLKGYIYGMMGLYYGPFKDKDVINHNIDITPENQYLGFRALPGKLMSYIGLSEPDYSLSDKILKLYEEIEWRELKTGNLHGIKHRGVFEHIFMRGIQKIVTHQQDATVLASIHEAISMLIESRLNCGLPRGCNFIFSGGSALNIKWNSNIYRSLKTNLNINDMYVPPFTNDSGSAIGAACAYNALANNSWSIDWNVYCGAEFIVDDHKDAKKTLMSAKELGMFLHDSGECVAVLSGKYESGPRALGHRSLIMSATDPKNKDFLNAVKKREDWRPVAPIALKEDAHKFFSISKEDKYMLFDNRIKKGHIEKIPAIIHIDDTARVQIVDESDFMFEVLTEYKKHSGVGILCNTSANKPGIGFFYRLSEAIDWAKESGVKYIWSYGILYKVKQ